MAAPSVVQVAFGSGDGVDPTVTLPGAPTAGNWIVAIVSPTNGIGTPNTTDWTEASHAQFQSSVDWCYVYYRKVQMGDGAALPAFQTGSYANFTTAIAYEISGALSSWASALDQIQFDSSASLTTTYTSGSYTTGSADELVLASYGTQVFLGPAITPSVGWTQDEATGSAFRVQGSSHEAFSGSGSSVQITTDWAGHTDGVTRNNTFVFLKSVSATSYTLTANQGSYGLTGLTAAQQASMSAAKGVYLLTGQIAGRGYLLPVRTGHYHTHGQSVSIGRNYRLTVRTGKYKVHKQKTILVGPGTSIIWPIEDGEYVLDGQDVVFGQEFLRLSFSEFISPTYLDWSSQGGADFDSILDTAYVVPSDVMTWTQAPYLYVFVSDADDPDEVGLLCSVVRDWALDGNLPKTGTPIEVYRHRDGYLLSVTKNRIRGRGRVMKLQFRSETGKAFNLRGWAMWIEKNYNV